MTEQTRQSGDAHWTRRTPEKIKCGPNAAGAKLSEAQIAELCARWQDGKRNKSWLARTFGVDRVTVWRHLRARGLL